MGGNEEIWRTIKEFPEYEVSSFGRVRRLFKNGYFYKKINHTARGYYTVHLKTTKYNKVILVHRLVAQAFIPNPNNYPQVNHKDENKLNNNVCNLEWCTSEYNINYGTRNNKVSNKLSKAIYQYDMNGKLVHKWHSMVYANKNGYSSSHPCRACKGLIKSYKNYIWRYA